METSGIKRNLTATISLEDSALDEHFFTFYATCYLNIDKGKNCIPAKFNAAAFLKFKSPAKSRKDDMQEQCTKMMALTLTRWDHRNEWSKVN